MKTTTQTLIIAFFILSVAACSTTEYRKFNGHIEELSKVRGYEGTFRRVKSPNIQLEIYSFSAAYLVPTAGGGFSLFIEGNADYFKPNTLVKVPNENIQILYYRDYHHIGWFERDFLGKIEILDLNENFIIADIDIQLKSSGKRFNLKAKFKHKDVAEFNHVER